LEILLCISYTALFILLINKMRFFQLDGVSRLHLSAIYLVKIGFGFVLFYIYSSYYPDRSTADIFKFFDDSKYMYDALYTEPSDFFRMLFSVGNDAPHFNELYYSNMMNWHREFENNVYNDSHTIIRFNAVLRIFSFGHYHVHTIFMCFLSLVGLTGIHKAFSASFAKQHLLYAAAIFLIPSVMFWGSGALKEGLVLLGMGLLLFYFQRFLKRQFSIAGVVALLFSLLLLFHMKFYVLMALIPGLMAYWWVTKTNEKYILLKYATSLVGFVLMGLNLHHILPNYRVLYLLMRKQKDFIGLAEFQESGSMLDITPLDMSLMSFLQSAPEALSNTFFRPFFFETNSALMLFSGLENLGFAVLLLLSIVFMKPLKRIDWNTLSFCLSFVLVLFLVIGWTTPVMGAIVRYKLPALPFLVMLCALLIDPQKIKRLVTRISFRKSN
jgi:hypothetical protein